MSIFWASTIFFICATVDANPLFDGNDIFPIDNPAGILQKKSFGYAINKVCNVRNIGKRMFASIENPYGFERSVQGVVGAFKANKEPVALACFNYRGYSWVIYRYDNDSYTSFVRAHFERSFMIPLNYTLISFDHMNSELYMFVNNTLELYRFNLDSLEKFWTLPNYLGELVEKRQSMNSLYDKIDTLNESIDELMIFNGTVYYRSGKYVKKKRIGMEEVETLQMSNPFKFNFIMFIPFSKLVKRVSIDDLPTLLSSSTVISIAPPPIPEHNGIAYFIYILNILAVVIVLYLCRKKKTDKRRMVNNDIYMEVVEKV